MRLSTCLMVAALTISDAIHTASLAAEQPRPLAPAQLREARREAAHRQRRIIFNNDGDDVLCFSAAPTPEALLEARTSALVGSQVDTIFYCSSQSFGMTLHNSMLNEVQTRTEGVYARNIIKELIAQGTDCLRIMVGFGHAHGMEVFYSMRMNDTHDASPSVPEMFPRFKKDHPELLFGALKNRPKYGQWSGVNYGRPEARERVFRTVEEVCENYDVDGVELDFFRHPVFFRRHAWGESCGDPERDMMTGLLRRVRRMTEQVGLRRGRPILVAVRTPDSAPYCQAIGLDVTRWMQEELLDLWIAGGYFRLCPWEDAVALGHKCGVQVYPSLDESRIRADTRGVRNKLECFRARAMQAWAAGVDGIYLFNLFNPKLPHWRELGDPKELQKLDKLYVVVGRGPNQARSYLAQGDRFATRPMLCPEQPTTLQAGQPYSVTLMVGDDVLWGNDQGVVAEVTLSLETEGLASADALGVAINGAVLAGGVLADGWLDLSVPASSVCRGANAFDITLRAGAENVALKDLHLRIHYLKRGISDAIDPIDGAGFLLGRDRRGK